MGHTLTSWELRACAYGIERKHRERAPVFVAELIGALALSDDVDGIAHWKAIAPRLDALRGRSLQ